MAYRIEVLGAPFTGQARARLVTLFTETLGVSEATAAVIASVSPCMIDGVESPSALDRVLQGLTSAGFESRLVASSSAGASAPPTTEEILEELLLSDFRDYYKLLGLSPSASGDHVKAAYRDLSKRYHPDRFTSSSRLSFYTEMQRTLNEAYETLGDPDRRAQYDRQHARLASSGAENASGYTRVQRAQDEFVISLGFFDQGQYETAIEALNRALFLDPELTEAEALLFVLSLESGNRDRALELATRMAARPSTQMEGRFALAQVYALSGDVDELKQAVELCAQVLNSEPDHIGALVVRASAYGDLHNPVDGILTLQEAIGRIGRHPDLVAPLVLLHAALGDDFTSRRLAGEVVPLLPPERQQELDQALLRVQAYRQRVVQAGKVRYGISKHQTLDSEAGCGGKLLVIIGAITAPLGVGIVILAIYLFVTHKSSGQRLALAEQDKALLAVNPSFKSRKLGRMDCLLCDHHLETSRRKRKGVRVEIHRCSLLRNAPIDVGRPLAINPCEGWLYSNTRWISDIGRRDELVQRGEFDIADVPRPGAQQAEPPASRSEGASAESKPRPRRFNRAEWETIGVVAGLFGLVIGWAVLANLPAREAGRAGALSNLASAIPLLGDAAVESRQGYVRTSYDGWLALRSGPSASNTQLAQIPDGTRLELFDCQGQPPGEPRWCRTQYQGQEGWVFDRYVITSPSTSDASTAAPAPSQIEAADTSRPEDLQFEGEFAFVGIACDCDPNDFVFRTVRELGGYAHPSEQSTRIWTIPAGKRISSADWGRDSRNTLTVSRHAGSMTVVQPTRLLGLSRLGRVRVESAESHPRSDTSLDLNVGDNIDVLLSARDGGEGSGMYYRIGDVVYYLRDENMYTYDDANNLNLRDEYSPDGNVVLRNNQVEEVWIRIRLASSQPAAWVKVVWGEDTDATVELIGATN